MLSKLFGAALAIACVATPEFAHAQTTTEPPPAEQSGAALAQQATNPFSSAWLLQTQQNNNWLDMPGDRGDRRQSDLLFQPLISVPLADQWGLYLRPVLTAVNSTLQLRPNGDSERSTGFGDTVLGIAAAHPLLGGRLMIGAGPTFIFPTASKSALGQDTWQMGPDVGATLVGKHFIAYGFVQQWFKVGGDGPETNQMSGVFDYTYSFDSGWTVGTQPSLSINRKASVDNRVAFGIGPQVGKVCKCGGMPTLVQMQVQYYAVRPTVGGPKWNIQLQVTPMIPALIKKRLF
jgi:hypothetical protein